MYQIIVMYLQPLVIFVVVDPFRPKKIIPGSSSQKQHDFKESKDRVLRQQEQPRSHPIGNRRATSVEEKSMSLERSELLIICCSDERIPKFSSLYYTRTS